MPLEFLVDRDLGTRIVPGALRGCGCTVHTLADVWGPDRAQVLDDAVWIEWAASRGVLALTADQRVRRLPAFHRYPVAIFALPSGNLQGPEQATRFTDNLERIDRIASQEPRPFLAVCYRDEVRVKARRVSE